MTKHPAQNTHTKKAEVKPSEMERHPMMMVMGKEMKEERREMSVAMAKQMAAKKMPGK